MIYNYDEVLSASIKYFEGDILAATTWINKYCLRDSDGNLLEKDPSDMHRRLAKELARIEMKYPDPLTESEIFELLDHFKYIVPQGGSMAGIGNDHSIQSLSNCFVVGNQGQSDSYGGILKIDQELIQLMKRRGGVGTDLSTLRPANTKVTNAARTSSGVVSFMERYSNSTREVAQQGRRGALMLSILITHPDAEMFIDAKVDTTKITGANVSVKITDEFMKAVENNEMFLQRFPVDTTKKQLCGDSVMVPSDLGVLKPGLKKGTYYRWVDARKLWDKIIYNAWKSAEPGVLFWDTIISESPADSYGKYGFNTVSTNPCFTGDTLVAVADGRNAVSIKQLADEGIEFPVYCASPNESNGDKSGGWKTYVSTARAFKTGEKKVIKVTLSDGSTFKCTEDHRLATVDCNYVQAKDSLGLELAKFYSQFKSVGYGTPYRFINSESYYKQYHYIAQYYELEGYGTGAVHHIDGDSSNDIISNLKVIDFSEHQSQHMKEDNPVHKMNQDYFKLLNKRKNILANASRYGWSEDDKIEALKEFDETYGEELAKLKSINEANKLILKVPEVTYSIKVVEIEYLDEIESVYDLNVDDYHNFYIITKSFDDKHLNTSGILVHNCGEIPLCPYDSCRLFAINLYSYVDNPFTKDASINYNKLHQHTIYAQKLMDDMIDLEVEKIDKIISKIESDPEDIELKSVELNLWKNVRDMALKGRRTGLGTTAEGDMLAALGLRYASEEAIEVSKTVHALIAESSYDSSVFMAKNRGSFEVFNYTLDRKSKFIKRLEYELHEGTLETWKEYGRRNISNLTLAPTGTVSLMTQTTSGIEPAFSVMYKRRRKTTDKSKAIFTDSNGDMFEEYLVFHHKFVEWYRITNSINSWNEAYESLSKLNQKELDKVFESSPYYHSTANDVDWVSKVKMQGEIQKWIDHSISCTVNVPKETTVELVNEIYLTAWRSGCKGVTIYRDGSRDGVLVSASTEVTKKPQTKTRPETIDAAVVRFRNGSENWVAFVGLVDGKPWEIFTGKIDDDIKYLPKSIHNGKIVKVSVDDNTHRYDFIYDVQYGYQNALPDIGSAFNPEYYNYARFVSAMMQEGTKLETIVNILGKLKCGETINIWNKGVARALKKFIEDGSKSGSRCPHCGAELVYYNGCTTCPGCGQGGKCD